MLREKLGDSATTIRSSIKLACFHSFCLTFLGDVTLMSELSMF